MKLTKSKLKQIIKEEMQKALRESEDEYNVGEFVVVKISDDRYEKDIEKIDNDDVESHISNEDKHGRGSYLSAKFLAKIMHVSQGKYEPIKEELGRVDMPEELFGAIGRTIERFYKGVAPLVILPLAQELASQIKVKLGEPKEIDPPIKVKLGAPK